MTIGAVKRGPVGDVDGEAVRPSRRTAVTRWPVRMSASRFLA